jgi:hypothetical protein
MAERLDHHTLLKVAVEEARQGLAGEEDIGEA